MVDTNVLIDAADADSGEKHRQAKELIERLINQDLLALSAQILNEFYAVATRPTRPPSLPHDRAVRFIKEISNSSKIVPLMTSTTLLSFWDSLVWAAAKDNEISIIDTEDFQHGRDAEGVQFINPFLGGASCPSEPGK